MSLTSVWRIGQSSQSQSTRSSFLYEGVGTLLSPIVEIPPTWRLLCLLPSLHHEQTLPATYNMQEYKRIWLKLPVFALPHQHFHDVLTVALSATVVKKLDCWCWSMWSACAFQNSWFYYLFVLWFQRNKRHKKLTANYKRHMNPRISLPIPVFVSIILDL